MFYGACCTFYNWFILIIWAKFGFQSSIGTADQNRAQSWHWCPLPSWNREGQEASSTRWKWKWTRFFGPSAHGPDWYGCPKAVWPWKPDFVAVINFNNEHCNFYKLTFVQCGKVWIFCLQCRILQKWLRIFKKFEFLGGPICEGRHGSWPYGCWSVFRTHRHWPEPGRPPEPDSRQFARSR